MIHFLSNCGDGNVLLGKDAEQISDFYAVKVDSDWEGLNSFGISIYSEGQRCRLARWKTIDSR